MIFPLKLSVISLFGVTFSTLHHFIIKKVIAFPCVKIAILLPLFFSTISLKASSILSLTSFWLSPPSVLKFSSWNCLVYQSGYSLSFGFPVLLSSSLSSRFALRFCFSIKYFAVCNVLTQLLAYTTSMFCSSFSLLSFSALLSPVTLRMIFSLFIRLSWVVL